METSPMKALEIKEKILAKLIEQLELYRVILFGSYAYGTFGSDSDIDLIVVLDSDFMPTTFEEDMENYHKVSSALRDIKRNIPMDLIVHTRPMHAKFLEMGSMFSREVARAGEVLYEKGD